MVHSLFFVFSNSISVIYAVTKKLFRDEDWSWIMDFNDDSHAYTKMIYVLKTSKAMGPKYKFGVEIPKSVKHALELDCKNGNNLWKEAMEKELAQLDQFKVLRLQKPGESLDGYEGQVWVVNLIIAEKLV